MDGDGGNTNPMGMVQVFTQLLAALVANPQNLTSPQVHGTPTQPVPTIDLTGSSTPIQVTRGLSSQPPSRADAHASVMRQLRGNRGVSVSDGVGLGNNREISHQTEVLPANRRKRLNVVPSDCGGGGAVQSSKVGKR